MASFVVPELPYTAGILFRCFATFVAEVDCGFSGEFCLALVHWAVFVTLGLVASMERFGGFLAGVCLFWFVSCLLFCCFLWWTAFANLV